MGRLLSTAWFGVAAIAIGCRPSPTRAGSPATLDPGPAPRQEGHPLAGVVGQQVLVAPVQSLLVAPELGWSIPRTSDALRMLDSDITMAVSERAGKHGWVYADGLIANFVRNGTYASDPTQLNAEPLRASLPVGTRLPEPLASEIRTMIAFYDARLVLIPVELRVERLPNGSGRPVLRLVLVEGRASEIQWSGEVSGDPQDAFGATVLTSVAARVADLVGPP
ncbi:MAG TPA: hypothetical protein VMH39_10305 [Gemmatimonadaceae bacterium]|nr:hypothetical protein [Gemmatimonadaceae bacterium]